MLRLCSGLSRHISHVFFSPFQPLKEILKILFTSILKYKHSSKRNVWRETMEYQEAEDLDPPLNV